jgi:hypothetical protein
VLEVVRITCLSREVLACRVGEQRDPGGPLQETRDRDSTTAGPVSETHQRVTGDGRAATSRRARRTSATPASTSFVEVESGHRATPSAAAALSRLVSRAASSRTQWLVEGRDGGDALLKIGIGRHGPILKNN